jgi:hypothetical protein
VPVTPPDLPPQDAPVAHPERRGRRRTRWVVGGVVVLLGVAFVLWWFQPQALLFDDVVDEAFPEAEAAAETDGSAAGEDEPETGEPDGQDTPDEADEPADGENDERDEEPADGDVAPTPTGPVELATGSFVSRNRYTVEGTATTYQLDDGERVLRLEGFSSTNGPDLFVYLTVAGAEDDDAALDAEFIDLGTLRGNVGDQNYVIPAEVDLDRYDSVVIWCRRFTTSFGVADLSS